MNRKICTNPSYALHILTKFKRISFSDILSLSLKLCVCTLGLRQMLMKATIQLIITYMSSCAQAKVIDVVFHPLYQTTNFTLHCL